MEAAADFPPTAVSAIILSIRVGT